MIHFYPKDFFPFLLSLHPHVPLPSFPSPHIIAVLQFLSNSYESTFCSLSSSWHCRYTQRQKTQYHIAKVYLTVSLGVFLLFRNKDTYRNVSLFLRMLVSIIYRQHVTKQHVIKTYMPRKGIIYLGYLSASVGMTCIFFPMFLFFSSFILNYVMHIYFIF